MLQTIVNNQWPTSTGVGKCLLPEDTPAEDARHVDLHILLRHKVEEAVLRDWGTLRYLDGRSFYEIQ